jgi:hypothetical protein
MLVPFPEARAVQALPISCCQSHPTPGPGGTPAFADLAALHSLAILTRNIAISSETAWQYPISARSRGWSWPWRRRP